jgi:site-specific recombinase XerD
MGRKYRPKGNRTGDHNKGKKFPPEPLTKQEVLGLLNACSRRAPTGIRDRALICLLWRGQLRISEALALKAADFDPAACTLRVLKGKGQKSRVVVVDPQAVEVLSTWLECRKKLRLNGHRPIFCTLGGRAVSSPQVRQMLGRRARKAGIEKRVHPHGLRHTGASELAAEGVALLDIQQQLGHGSAATTNKYLHTLDPMRRGEVMRQRKW